VEIALHFYLCELVECFAMCQKIPFFALANHIMYVIMAKKRASFNPTIFTIASCHMRKKWSWPPHQLQPPSPSLPRPQPFQHGMTFFRVQGVPTLSPLHQNLVPSRDCSRILLVSITKYIMTK
jgi:hypothetical protein